MKFFGYKRIDGCVGIRNHVLILPTSGCAVEVCKQSAERLNGAVTFINQNGCGETNRNLKLTQDIISGLAINPNIYGIICVGLGCEINTLDCTLNLIKLKTSKPIDGICIQQEGGTINAIAKTTQLAQKMILEASSIKREECDISEITVGIECGGSDATSGLAANPIVGQAADKLINMGATAMFGETSEMIGAEHLLASRCRSKSTAIKLLSTIKKREEDLKALGEDIRLSQPSPGNKDGGITTLEEKSLGCILKGGTSPIMEFVEYAKKPTKKGLVIMDTPAYDLNSVTALVAGGAQMIIFTTGRGSAIGNPVAPVIKVTANKNTFNKMTDNIDYNLSSFLSGEKIEILSQYMLDEIVDIANGKLTKAEILKYGFCDTVISRIADYL